MPVKADKIITTSSEVSFLIQPVPDPDCTLILIHGFPFHKGMWKNQLNNVSPSIQCIAYDVRGFGESKSGHEFYSIDLFTSDLIAFIRHLNLTKVILCGLSMGGYIALRAVERNPELFHGLILCDTNSSADSNDAKLNRFKSIEQIQKEGKLNFTEEFLKKALSPNTINSNAAITDFTKEMIHAVPDNIICATQLALASRTDTTSVLSQINIPTLIIRGEEDQLMKEEQAEFLHSEIKGSKLCQISKSGHLPNLENPDEFNSCINRFLEALL